MPTSANLKKIDSCTLGVIYRVALVKTRSIFQEHVTSEDRKRLANVEAEMDRRNLSKEYYARGL